MLTDAKAGIQAARLAERAPLPGRSVILVDTSDLRPRCLTEARPDSYSRANPLHLMIATGLAFALYREGYASAAYISPYRAQAYLARRLQARFHERGFLRTATVHRFQGSEAEAVILDLVDASPQKGASKLTGGDIQIATRLVNVAISRAKGKLFVLADLSFIQKRHLPASPSARLLRLISAENVVPACNLLCGAEEHLCWFDSWEAAQGALASDIRRAEAPILASLPPGFLADSDLLDALTSPALRGSRLIAPLEVALPLEGRDYEGIDVQLDYREHGFVLCLGSDLAWVGGHSPAQPIARLLVPRAAEVLGDLLFGTLSFSQPSHRVPRPTRHAHADGQEDLPF